VDVELIIASVSANALKEQNKRPSVLPLAFWGAFLTQDPIPHLTPKGCDK